jgi:hypothetical protein
VTSGTEVGRDWLTRYSRGKLGYSLFTYSTGCAAGVHDLRKGAEMSWCDDNVAEKPFRFATGSRDMMASHKPSTWVACCIPPDSYFRFTRYCSSHFGLRDPVPAEWRFNAVHLDGHVDDAVWMETRPIYSEYYCDWLFKVQGTYNNEAPYGWQYRTTSTPTMFDNADDNLEPIPGFPRAFDCNK